MPPSRAQRAKTAQRRNQAIQLRLAGAEWQQIADTLGYADKAAANKDVTRALELAAREQRASAEVMLETELQRLDRLQRALWPNALNGDTKAADTILRISDRRMKWTGNDVPPDVEERIRRELAPRVAAQIFQVLRVIADGLALTEEQRTVLPTLVEKALGSFMASERRVLEGQVVEGEAA